MAIGDVTVVAFDRFSVSMFVEREPSATKWTLYLDGAATSVVDEPIPSPFIYKLEGLLPGEHQIDVAQIDVTDEIVVQGEATFISGKPTYVIASVDQVGAILRSRTQDDHDDEIGTFTEDTRPTRAEVELLIVQAYTVVLGATGSLDELKCTQADLIREQARYWQSLLTAMLIELSYFPEQVRSDRSAYVFYKEMWDDATTGFSSLIDAVAECKGGEIEPDVPGEDGTNVPPDPSWAFPEDVGGMVGWQTRF